VGPRAVLDAVVKRKFSSPCRESNSRTPIVQPVAQSLYRLNCLTNEKTQFVVVLERYFNIHSFYSVEFLTLKNDS
jgi:hypothetical protein